MDHRKRHGTFLSWEKAQKKNWSFTVTVRRGFYKKLLSFLHSVPVYHHLPTKEGSRSVRVYNADYLPEELAIWIHAHDEPFDLQVAHTEGFETNRYDAEGIPRTAHVYPEADISALPSWEDQDQNRKRYLTEKLLDT